jgi:cob(I)alamin adenosyltransferase
MVDFVQFMKSGHSGEVSIFNRIPQIRYRCPGEHPFIMSKGPQPVHYEHAEKALAYALEAPERGTQLLICDEILDTVLFRLLDADRLMQVMECCKGRIELVMTGRDAPPDLIRSADYVTELVQVKHPYYSGARAREGIEY